MGPNAQLRWEKLDPRFVTDLPESVVTGTKAYGKYSREWSSNLPLATVLSISQFSGSSCTSGGVGSGFIPSARALNFSTCKRDRLSASMFRAPFICRALNRMLFLRQMSTRVRSKLFCVLCCLFVDDVNNAFIICCKTNSVIHIPPL